MGARGPKASGGYGEKTKVLSTRITAPIRKALEDASKASGLSLSSEVERRLRQSFDDDRIIKNVADPQLYAILRTIAATMDFAGRQSLFASQRKIGGAPDWLNDPYAYDQALKATVTVLEGFRPAGDPSPPKISAKQIAEIIGTKKGAVRTKKEAAKLANWVAANTGILQAEYMLSNIAEAEPTQPLPGTKPKRAALARRIASELGSIRDRLKGDKT